ncbi:MAG: PspC domain-containing protein [Bacteroidales bacterium]|nr:PspC domain-containing protein [Bacteroidales bacterium]
MEKKLFLNKENGKIAGVCAGLADYFGIDVNVIRILFLVSLLFASFGFWVYLIIWVIAPVKPSDGGYVQYGQ